MEGRLPRGFCIKRLTDLPMLWSEQWGAIGLQAPAQVRSRTPLIHPASFREPGQGPHYLDITGEIDVFEGLFARDAEAQRAGVTLMPGVGFDVVPSDCLAAHLKRRLPDATHLTIYLSAGFNVSRGTAKTAIEGIADGLRARRNGRLVTLARPDTGSCNFGKGLRRTIQIPWGDDRLPFDRHSEHRSPC